MSHDPLSISNTVLELAGERGIRLRCHELQRVVYFAHGLTLARTRLPLVSGCFEAWRSGPVHPVIYLAFGRACHEPVRFRATGGRLFGNVAIDPPAVEEPRIVDLLRRMLSPEWELAPGRLCRLARAESAPWHHVVTQAREARSVSLRISNSCVIERFGWHKLGADATEDRPEPLDVPFSFREFRDEALVPA